MERNIRKQLGWEFIALLNVTLLSADWNDKDSHCLRAFAGQILQHRFAENSLSIRAILSTEFFELTACVRHNRNTSYLRKILEL